MTIKIFTRIALLFALVISVNGCKSYKQVSMKSEEFLADEQLAKDVNIGYYNLYTHHGTTSFRVKDPKISGGKLTGTLEPVNQSDVTFKPKGKKAAELHKRDIHVWLKDMPADTSGKPLTGGGATTISSTSIKKVGMYGNDEKGIFKTILGAIVALLLGALIITGMIFLLAKGSENASDGSNSNSGSGDSNSGCYVATMVYGSYEAPEVLVLRKFRDRFLARFYFGRQFISWYYKNSPGFVERYKDSGRINTAIRYLLNIFVRFLAWAGFSR